MSSKETRTFVDHELTINGLRLHYTEWGDKSLPTILCIGGIIQESHVWDVFAEELSDQYRVVCLDLRGQGDSEWSREGYALTSFVRDIYEFVRRIDALPFHFVGHSLGARLAIAYDALFPGDIGKAVLSDFGPGIERETALGIRAGLIKYYQVTGWRNHDEALAYWQERYAAIRPIFHEKYVRHNLRVNWANRLVPKADPDLFFLTTSAAAPDLERLWAWAGEVRAPMLLARGMKKETPGHVSDEIAERMTTLMPSLTIEDFDAGHSVFQELPEQFAASTRAYLAQP